MTGASHKALCWFEKKQTILDLNGLGTNDREKKQQIYIKYSRSATQLGDSRVRLYKRRIQCKHEYVEHDCKVVEGK